MRGKEPPWPCGHMIWFATAKEKGGSYVLGVGILCGYFAVEDQATWARCIHCWPGSLADFKCEFGYTTVYAWCFSSAHELNRPVRRQTRQGPGSFRGRPGAKR
jgi:hypothetical protein